MVTKKNNKLFKILLIAFISIGIVGTIIAIIVGVIIKPKVAPITPGVTPGSGPQSWTIQSGNCLPDILKKSDGTTLSFNNIDDAEKSCLRNQDCFGVYKPPTICMPTPSNKSPGAQWNCSQPPSPGLEYKNEADCEKDKTKCKWTSRPYELRGCSSPSAAKGWCVPKTGICNIAQRGQTFFNPKNPLPDNDYIFCSNTPNGVWKTDDHTCIEVDGSTVYDCWKYSYNTKENCNTQCGNNDPKTCTPRVVGSPKPTSF